jgi:hypothetical protein
MAPTDQFPTDTPVYAIGHLNGGPALLIAQPPVLDTSQFEGNQVPLRLGAKLFTRPSAYFIVFRMRPRLFEPVAPVTFRQSLDRSGFHCRAWEAVKQTAQNVRCVTPGVDRHWGEPVTCVLLACTLVNVGRRVRRVRCALQSK